MNKFTTFARHNETGEVLGVYSDEGDYVYLVPKNQWENEFGWYDAEFIFSAAYPKHLFSFFGEVLT